MTRAPSHCVAILGCDPYKRWPLVVSLSGLDTYDKSKPYPGSHILRRQVLVDDEEILLWLNWEWASCRHTEEYCQHYTVQQYSACALVIYDRNDRASFAQVPKFMEGIRTRRTCQYVPIFIIGCECDEEGERVVSTEEGENLAQSYSCQFYEASAVTNEGVQELLEEIGRAAKNYYLTRASMPPKSGEELGIKSHKKHCSVQ